MSATATVQSAAKPPSSAPSGSLIQRQCACGGSAGLSGECEECRSRKLSGRPLQKKLVIGNPEDEFEQEADRVAAQVMRMPHPQATTEAEQREPAPIVRRRVDGFHGTGAGPAPSIVREVLASPGRPLDGATRAFFEPRFGYDFGQVRVHHDDEAAQSADSVTALAYTSGCHIVFARGQYGPHGTGGRQLLAHELAHVIQQGGAQAASTIYRQCTTGRACTQPISGDPGRFTMPRNTRRKSPAAPRAQRKPRRDPGAVVASGHGSHAAHVEAFAAAEGIDLSDFYGVLIDRDLGASTGAAAGPCASLTGAVPPFAGPRDAYCMFVPEDMDRLTGEAAAAPPPRLVGGYPRAAWLQWLRENARPRGPAYPLRHHRASGFGRILYTLDPVVSGRQRKPNTPLDFYLSELSAILAEFEPTFASVRRRSPAGDYGALLDNVQSAYHDALFSHYESIAGILTTLRCHCDCADADAFVRDTFEFTSTGWSDTTRGIFLDFIQSRMPSLQWPDPGP
jgi:hypothetical protein